MGDHWGESEKPDFNPRLCSVRVSVDIGVHDEDWVNYFYIQVVTPEYLSSCGKSMWGRSLLVIQIFTWDEVERMIEEFVTGISTESWDDAVKILTRYLDWEYEGMEAMNPRANQ